MERSVRLTAVVLAAALGGAGCSKVCKEPASARSVTRIEADQKGRESRATDNAIGNWSEAVREKHGFLFSYWFRADARATDCRSAPKSSTCTVKAKPCRLL